MLRPLPPRAMSEPALQQLHALLSALSPLGEPPSSTQRQDRPGEEAPAFGVSSPWFHTRIRHDDISTLAGSLFSDLQERSEYLFSVAAVPAALASQSGSLSLSFSQEGFLLLLRCCIATLRLLEFDFGLLVEKCEILLGILRKLCRPNPPFSSWICNRRNVATESAELKELRGIDARRLILDFFASILEVFVDELLMHEQLRKHFSITDKISASTDKLFVSNVSNGEIPVIQEIMSSHFLISIQCDWKWKSITGEVVNRAPKLSLDASMVLLCICRMPSVSHMLRAHMVLAVSECISVQVVDNSWKWTEKSLSTYISAFEVSVDLYITYCFGFDCFKNHFGCKEQHYCISNQLLSNSHFHPLISDQLQHNFDFLVDFCCFNFNDMLSGDEADITTQSTAYVKDKQKIFDGMCKEQTIFIVESIISRIVSEESEKNIIHEWQKDVSEEMICINAILKLMSSSLLQILLILRQKGDRGGKRNTEEHTPGKACNYVLSIISRFSVFDTVHLNNNILGSERKSLPKHEEPILMLTHFASLLLFSLRRKFGILWKSSILMVAIVLNLFHYGEGNLEMLTRLLDETKTVVFDSNSQKVLLHRSSSAVIASNLQHIQKLYLRDSVHCFSSETECGDGVEEISKDPHPRDRRSRISSNPTSSENKNHPCASEPDTCNGESFINSLQGYLGNDSSEYDDLVDFIECKRGKDYSAWLRKRTRFRKWQQEKKYEKARFQKKSKAAEEPPKSRNAPRRRQ